ncbi:MAG: tetratricopeptide repeat protein [Tabrizicola sp.]|nr:tetratricopeptide repeat protein [Tabrizicola sp.]
MDHCQGETSLADATILADWNSMIRAFLAHGANTPVHLTAVLTRAPDFAMGHAVKGLFCMLLGRKEMVTTARECLVAARAGQADHPRERGLVLALDHWLAGHPSQSIAELEKILRTNPADTLVMKLGHAIRFVMGDSLGMRRSVERVIGAHGADHPFRGFALGCHAFTLEETGDYAGAERAGLEGLQHAVDDAWGLHAVAHVYDMTHQPGKGIEVIDDHSGTWLGCNNFRYHVWWHKALLHLDQGEIDHVIALYDDRIRADKTDDYRDISNAASLLMRLSLEGVPVGQRWEELADLAERRIEDGCLAFADLHYMLALIGGEREAAVAKLLHRIADEATRQGGSEFDRILAHPGYACANGLAAFAEGDFGKAFKALAAARPVMQTVGGSHAQRDIFERLTIDAGLRAGYFAQTEGILRQRTALRAGREDAFAARRREALAAARQGNYVVAAQ